jgi:hypothetical protein
MLYDFVVDKKTPQPARQGGGRGLAYPFGDLEIGQSLFFKGRATHVSVASANKNLTPKHFVSRVMQDGVRVFRDK